MKFHETDVLIVGAGPCGLGAATQLERLQADGLAAPSYLLIDARISVGGWASSVTTLEGFTFDYGGHVLFPHKHYPDFANEIQKLSEDWHHSIPKRGVWVDGVLVPYPVQRNIQRLRLLKALKCLFGLTKARLRAGSRNTAGGLGNPPLGEYLEEHFGAEMSQLILGPLNQKMWAYPPEALDSAWVSYRSGSRTCNVASVSLLKLVCNMLLRRDDPGWTDQTRVPYPGHGGTGALWARLGELIPASKMMLGHSLVQLDSKERIAWLFDGTMVRYETLISSIPLDLLLQFIVDRPDLSALSRRLIYSQAHLLGLGIEGPLPEQLRGIHSFHVPQPDVPFWRVNFPGAFSPGNVPDSKTTWSVLCEASVAKSSATEVPPEACAASMETGLRKMGVLREPARVVSRWSALVDHGYPTPFLGRDSLLPLIHARLERVRIFSRGRFGGWRYEISNQDHSFMQGVEVVNRLVLGDPEVTYMAGEPSVAEMNRAAAVCSERAGAFTLRAYAPTSAGR